MPGPRDGRSHGGRSNARNDRDVSTTRGHGGGPQGRETAGGGGGDRPRLPGAVYRDLRAAAGADVDRVAAVYAAAGVALEAGEVTRAVALLRDAKQQAGRSGAVREALGIALYLAGDYAAAARELTAYRRLTGRVDQNHLAADCARATDDIDRAERLVADMIAGDAPADRVAEGLLVVAGARADGDDVRAALGALHRMDLSPSIIEPHHLRVWYLAADLHERLDEHDKAVALLEAIVTIEPEFLDVAERLAAAGG